MSRTGRYTIQPMRCKGTSKQHHRQCQAWAIPGTLWCRYHFGNTAKHRQEADTRMTLAALMNGDARHPWEVVLEATAIGDALMRDAKVRLAEGETVTVEQVDRMIELTQFAHHMAKTAIDTKAHENVAIAYANHLEAQGRVAGEALMVALDVALAAIPDEYERAAVRERAVAAMHAALVVQAGEAPRALEATPAGVDDPAVVDVPVRGVIESVEQQPT